MLRPADATQRIAALNDRLRKEQPPGSIVFTAGVRYFGRHASAWLLDQLAKHDAFDTDTDPHGEHDFGVMELRGERVFWKIDYYDETLTAGSEAPWDPDRCRRVLTFMMAAEY